MSLEALHWHASAFVLFGLPLVHTAVASIPLTLTERVRDYTSLPLPFFLRRFRLLLLKPSGISRLTSCHFRQWWSLCFSVPSSILHAWHLLTSDQPMSNSLFCVQPPSKKIFLSTLRCFSVQFSPTFFRKRAGPGSSRAWPPTSSSTLIGLSAPASF